MKPEFTFRMNKVTSMEWTITMRAESVEEAQEKAEVYLLYGDHPRGGEIKIINQSAALISSTINN
jgi:hypothetical protein